MFKIPTLFVLLNILSSSISIKIQPIEDNFIITTEAKVRDVFNSFLDILNLHEEIKQELDKYITIQNHLLAITLQSYEVIEQIKSNYSEITENLFDININNDIVHEKTIFDVIKKFLVDLDYYKSRNGKDIVFDAFIQNEVVLNNTDYVQDYDDLEESTEENGGEFWVSNNLVESRRIFQGENAKIKLFPFLAVILVFKQFYCAGTIIDTDYILTAASCLQIAWTNTVFRDNPTFLTIRVGSSYYAAGGQILSVKQIHFHPGFDSRTLKNNICLLRLSKSLNLNGEKQRIKKVEFDRDNSTELSTKESVTIVGWGPKNHASTYLTMAESLAFDHLDIYSLRDCQDIYSKDFVTESNFCAGFVSKGGGACNHDVGAPGIVNGILTGIVTFGSPVCGTPDAPTVFIKVGFYAEWLQNIMYEKNPNNTILTTEKVTTEKTTTENSKESEQVQELLKQNNTVLDERAHTDDDELYLGFVRTLQAKDLMEVFNAKSKPSEESKAESNEKIQDQDMEKKKRKVLALLKEIVKSTKKYKRKHHKKHDKTTKSKINITTTVAYDSSSASKEFMDLLQGKLLNSKTNKHKLNKKSSKSTKKFTEKSSKIKKNNKAIKKHQKLKKNRDALLTEEIKKWLREVIITLTTTTREPTKKVKYQTNINDINNYDVEGTTTTTKQPIKKEITQKNRYNTVKDKTAELPVSFDYYEQSYTRQKIKKILQNKINLKLNKKDDNGTDIDDDASEYYDDITISTNTPTMTTVKHEGQLYADNVENIAKDLSTFVKSIYYNSDFKDTIFRAETAVSNNTQFSLALTMKDKDDLRRNKGLETEPQKLANSFRHWLVKTNDSNSIMYNKSDNEIYDLLKLALHDM